MQNTESMLVFTQAWHCEVVLQRSKRRRTARRAWRPVKTPLTRSCRWLWTARRRGVQRTTRTRGQNRPQMLRWRWDGTLCVCWEIWDVREGTFSWKGNKTLYIMVKQEKALFLVINVVQTNHQNPTTPPHPVSAKPMLNGLWHLFPHMQFMLLYISMHITQLSDFHKYPDVRHHVLYYWLYCHVY